MTDYAVLLQDFIQWHICRRVDVSQQRDIASAAAAADAIETLIKERDEARAEVKFLRDVMTACLDPHSGPPRERIRFALQKGAE